MQTFFISAKGRQTLAKFNLTRSSCHCEDIRASIDDVNIVQRIHFRKKNILQADVEITEAIATEGESGQR